MSNIFLIPGFYIPFSDLYLTDTLRLNQFQRKIHDLVNEGRDVLVTAPTGGGKTLSLLLNTTRLGSLRGFTALYPNNTLLKNQMTTVEEILKEHFNAKPVFTTSTCSPGDPECVEPLKIYEVDTNTTREAWSGDKYVALLALSGKYIQSEPGVPKREVLYSLAEKVFRHDRRGGAYTIVFSTPDTYLLVSTGAYMDFEAVGKTMHNILVAIAMGVPREKIEDILRKTGTLTRARIRETIAVSESLLDLPLFIDEFHLYDAYEVDALYALLKLYKDVKGLPVVFSSATPAHDIREELSDVVDPEEVGAEVTTNSSGFPVKGDTRVIAVPVDTRRKGLLAFYEAVNLVPEIVVDSNVLSSIKSLKDGRALIIVDRLWMVASLARKLHGEGVPVKCIASIIPDDVCVDDANIIVGSEATTQGVNLGRVVLGVMSGTSSEDVVQRTGRIGRRGVDSTLYLIIPRHELEENPPRARMNYYEFVEWVSKVFPNYPKRKRSISRLLPGHLHEARRKLIYGLGIASLARVSGMTGMLKKIDIGGEDTLRLLNTVIAPPEMLARLMLFRRTGFSISYIVEETGRTGTASIGIITRNFAVKNITRNGDIVIELKRARSTLTARIEADPGHIKGKITDLKTLLRLLRGFITINNNIRIGENELTENTLVYIGDLGPELAYYLSYTGEGASIQSPSAGTRYAMVFI